SVSSGSTAGRRYPPAVDREAHRARRPSAGEANRRLGLGWWVRAGVAVLGRPGLWPTAVGQAVRLARPGWWRRPPFLPVPDPDYVTVRLEADHGPHRTPAGGGLVAYLNWCREVKP